MRIAINCRSILLSQRTGIGRYTYHLLDSLGKVDKGNSYTLHAPKRIFDLKRRLPDFSRYRNFKGKLDFFHQGITNADIYHLPCPDNIPLYSGRLVVTIHDLIHKTYPEGHDLRTIELTEKHMQALKARADRFICISENTRQDLHALYDIPLERTSVVYNGVDHGVFFPMSSQERQAASQELKAMGVEKPFILFVGTIEPRKNLSGLLEALAQLKSKGVFLGQLVVAGMKGWMVEGIKGQVHKLNITKDVIFTGYISDLQLRQLYNLAEVFVFPSFYEGFGFPILEAFCCGAAVIVSKTSSCGEIAGNAAITIDPQNIGDMASAIEQVLADGHLKRSLMHAGLKRAREFSFNSMAQQTIDVYQKTIQ